MKDFINFIQEEEKKYTGIKPDATDLIIISDANHYFNKYQAKQLILSGVSQQRELLINYNNYLYAEYHGADYDDEDIDVFLKAMDN